MASLMSRDEPYEVLKSMDRLPRLPKTRPRALTPPGFRDSDSHGPPYARFQESCAYFQLPPNIRADILRLAFGDGRLHMNLSYGHPDERHRSAANHAGIANNASARFWGQRERSLDTAQPKSWSWWSSVCHRLAPDETGINTNTRRPGQPPMTRGGLSGPWADRCREGDAAHCLTWRGSEGGGGGGGTSSACYVGIMGWLLSCRQNYAEGIEVLYSTNTLIMMDEVMMTHLPQLVLPERLRMITALEMKWPLKTRAIWDELDDADLDDEHLETVLQLLSLHFPSLRRLHMLLESGDQYWAMPHQRDDHVSLILKHLDGFAKRTPRLRECAFSLSEWLFAPLYEEAASEPTPSSLEPPAEAVEEEEEEEKEQTGASYERTSYRQVWRDVEGKMSVVQCPFLDSYPAPPYHLAQAGGVQVPGYWILEGSDRQPPGSPSERSCASSFEDFGWMAMVSFYGMQMEM